MEMLGQENAYDGRERGHILLIVLTKEYVEMNGEILQISYVPNENYQLETMFRVNSAYQSIHEHRIHRITLIDSRVR